MTERKTPARALASVAGRAAGRRDEPDDTEPMPWDPTLVDASDDPTLVDPRSPVPDDGKAEPSQGEVDAAVAGLTVRDGERLQQEEPLVEESDEANSEWLSRALIALAQKASHPGMVRRYGPHSDGGDSVAYAAVAAPAAKTALRPDPSRKVVVIRPQEAPSRDAPTVVLARGGRQARRAAGVAALATLLFAGAAAGAWAWRCGGADTGGARTPRASVPADPPAGAPLAAPLPSMSPSAPLAASADIAPARGNGPSSSVTPVLSSPTPQSSRPRSTRTRPPVSVRQSAEGTRTGSPPKAPDSSEYTEELK
jgi:hypothetical protein